MKREYEGGGLKSEDKEKKMKKRKRGEVLNKITEGVYECEGNELSEERKKEGTEREKSRRKRMRKRE